MTTANTNAQVEAPKLKEGFNKVEIVGTLVEKNLEEKTNTYNGESTELIVGSISVRTGENEVHQVRLRSNKFTKAGKENALYKGYSTINREAVSVADFAEASEKLGKLSGVKSEETEGLLYTYKDLLSILNKKSFDTKIASNSNQQEIMKVSEKDNKYAYDVQLVGTTAENEALYKVTVEPTQVSINGSLTTNEYYGQDGQLKQYQQVQGKFVNRLTEKDDPTPKATFEVDVFVDAVRPEIKDDEETGRVKLSSWIPSYSSIFPYNFSVVAEGADFFTDSVEKGQTIKVYGQLLNVREEHVKYVPAGFGADIEEKTYTYVNEALIQTAAMPYDEESAKSFKPELVKEALVKREVYLEKSKAGVGQGQQQQSSTPPVGFGGQATTPKAPAAGTLSAKDVANLF